MTTRLHPLNAISIPLQTPPFLWVRTAKYPGDVFFYFFNFFTQKHKKSQKNARIIQYLCVHKFFHEQKKTHFFTKKNLGPDRYSYALNQNRHERFSSRKKTRKNVQKTSFLNIFGPQKCFKNHHFFIKNEHHVFNANSLFFTVIYM